MVCGLCLHTGLILLYLTLEVCLMVCLVVIKTGMDVGEVITRVYQHRSPSSAAFVFINQSPPELLGPQSHTPRNDVMEEEEKAQKFAKHRKTTSANLDIQQF